MAGVSTIYVTDLLIRGCDLAAEGRDDRFRELEDAYKDYTVYDRHYEKIGKVDDLFVDESDTPEYIGVKTGFLGMKSALIPMDLARVNDRRKLIEVAADKEAINNAPTFDDDKDITPDYEDRVHAYFGLEPVHSSGDRTGYGDYYASGDPLDARRDEDLSRAVDTEYGERTDHATHRTTGERSGEPPLEPLGGTSGGTSRGAPGDERRGSSVPEPGFTDSVDREEARRQLDDEPAASAEVRSPAGGDRAAGMRIYKRSRRGGI